MYTCIACGFNLQLTYLSEAFYKLIHFYYLNGNWW